MAPVMTRIWIAGPRAWENPEPIEKVLRKLIANYGIGRLLIVTGGAPGVDHLTEEACSEVGLHCVRVRACWPVGRWAGPVRNAVIAKELEPQALIALHYLSFEDNNHRGTQSAIKQARKYKIPYKVLRIKPHIATPSAYTQDSPLGNRARAEAGMPLKESKAAKRRRQRQRKA